MIQRALIPVMMKNIFVCDTKTDKCSNLAGKRGEEVDGNGYRR